MPVDPNIGCAGLINEYRNAYDKVQNALGAPSRMLGMLDNYADTLLGIPEDLLNGMINDLNGTISGLSGMFSLDGSGVLTALNKMLDCPVVADGDLGSKIGSMIDQIEAGGKVPQEALDLLTNAAKAQVGGFMGQLSDTKSDAIGSVNNLYNQAVEKSGINDVMKDLNTLASCVENACQGYDDLKEAIPGTIDSLTNKYRLVKDAAGNFIADPLSGVRGIKETVIRRLDQVNIAQDLINNLKATVI